MKAISRATGQWFAIKMIHESKVRRVTAANDNKSDADKAETAFMREIAILEDLDHPNICKLKEVFRDHGTIGKVFFRLLSGTYLTGAPLDLVLEFVDGGDLLDYILKTNGIGRLCSSFSNMHDVSAMTCRRGDGHPHYETTLRRPCGMFLLVTLLSCLISSHTVYSWQRHRPPRLETRSLSIS